MTPRELGYALGLLRPSPKVPGRASLAALMLTFPDEEQVNHGEPG